MGLNLVIGTNKSNSILRQISALARQELTYDLNLSDFLVDSLKVLDFFVELEDIFDITLSMQECAEVSTVSDLVELIENKI
jgi:acyl carrier protein